MNRPEIVPNTRAAIKLSPAEATAKERPRKRQERSVTGDLSVRYSNRTSEIRELTADYYLIGFELPMKVGNPGERDSEHG